MASANEESKYLIPLNLNLWFVATILDSADLESGLVPGERDF